MASLPDMQIPNASCWRDTQGNIYPSGAAYQLGNRPEFFVTYRSKVTGETERRQVTRCFPSEDAQEEPGGAFVSAAYLDKAEKALAYIEKHKAELDQASEAIRSTVSCDLTESLTLHLCYDLSAGEEPPEGASIGDQIHALSEAVSALASHEFRGDDASLEGAAVLEAADRLLNAASRINSRMLYLLLQRVPQ